MSTELIVAAITACGSAFVAGLFSVITKRMDKETADRKKKDEQMAAILERIQQNTEKTTSHDEAISTLTALTMELKNATDANSEGVKVLMRYMLQRYHATYMMHGYVTSHEKTDFLEAYTVYKSKGGNGTAEGWKEEVDKLPVRDDLPMINPYLELLKAQQKGE